MSIFKFIAEVGEQDAKFGCGPHIFFLGDFFYGRYSWRHPMTLTLAESRGRKKQGEKMKTTTR